MVDFLAAFVANNIAILLIISIFIVNRRKLLKSSPTNHSILLMMVILILFGISDSLTFWVDGKTGKVFSDMNVAFNSISYYLQLLVAVVWNILIICYINGFVRKKHIAILSGFSLIGLVFIVINLFTPILFSCENNVYVRKPLFWVFIAFVFIGHCNSFVFYFYTKSVGGITKRFPMWLFFTPVLVALLTQSVHYGISLLTAGEAISLVCFISSMQNEALQRDELTGLYNRAFLEQFTKSLKKHKFSEKYTLFMVDINHFKGINDTFGHEIGDEALIVFSKILLDVVASYGTVIRYAGDEFMILLYTQDDTRIFDFVNRIRDRLAEFSTSKEKPYELCASIGFCKINTFIYSIEDILKAADDNMYEDKKRYGINSR